MGARAVAILTPHSSARPCQIFEATIPCCCPEHDPLTASLPSLADALRLFSDYPVRVARSKRAPIAALGGLALPAIAESAGFYLRPEKSPANYSYLPRV